MRPEARRSLWDGLERLESGRFVGRGAELAALDGLLAAAGGGVAFICGPAGVGKSAFLQTVVGRQPLGRPLLRLRTSGSESLLALAQLDDRAPPLVVLEDFDQHPAATSFLRSTLLRSLPQGAVVLACSPPPETPCRRRQR